MQEIPLSPNHYAGAKFQPGNKMIPRYIINKDFRPKARCEETLWEYHCSPRDDWWYVDFLERRNLDVRLYWKPLVPGSAIIYKKIEVQ